MLHRYDALKKGKTGQLSYWDEPSVERRDWMSRRLGDYLLDSLREWIISFYLATIMNPIVDQYLPTRKRFPYVNWQKVALLHGLVLVGTDTTMPCQPGLRWKSKATGSCGKSHLKNLISRIPPSFRDNPNYDLPEGSMALRIMTLAEYYDLQPGECFTTRQTQYATECLFFSPPIPQAPSCGRS